ncbi:integrase [Kaistia sp. UC242_56]|uniref:integrase n=1 Tax=Kaistia sp. UC242_56 TaxID=3374625 RepID=UPI00378D38C2
MVKRSEAPGLKKKRNADGSFRWYWEARSDLVKRGYRPSTVRLHYPETAEGDAQRAARCGILWAEMLAWDAAGGSIPPVGYDGTIGSLARLFASDKDGPYASVKWNTQRLYDGCIKIIMGTVQARAVRALVGKDFALWHRNWGLPEKDGGKPRPYRAKHTMDTLRRIISYGVTLGYADCMQADTILGKMRFASPPPRTSYMLPEHVEMIRAKAHEMGLASVALATAFQFDLAMRQKDVIGEWLKVTDGEGGGIVVKGRRWANGLLWSDIGPDLIVRKKHVKTGFEVQYDLRLAPNVLAEVDLVPSGRRIGPVIVSEATGEPYKWTKYPENYRRVADAAGVPSTVWSMDARAGAISEAYAGGADGTDVQKHAGHTNPQTSAKYNRSSLKQTRRAMSQRIEARTKNET